MSQSLAGHLRPRLPQLPWDVATLPSQRVWMALGGAGLVALLGVAIPVLGLTARPFLIAAIAVVLLFPLATRVIRGTFDILEPIVPANLALFAMFVVRPLAILAYDGMIYGVEIQFDLEPTFDRALLLCLLGVAAFNAGYAVGFGRSLGRKVPGLPSQLHHDTVTIAAVGLITIGLLAYAVYAQQQGRNPLSIFLGGGALGGGADTTAYLYQAPFLIIPAALLFMHLGHSSRTYAPRIAAILLAVVVANSLTPAGQRLWLLLLLGSFVVYPMLRSGWRPSMGLLLIGAIPAFFVLVSMRDVSSGSPARFIAELSHSIADPSGAAEELVTGPDIEMFSAIATELQLMPDVVEYTPGNTFATLATKPIPRIFYEGKPRPTREYLVKAMRKSFTIGTAGTEFSPIGVFYADSRYVGVVAGMFAIGIGLRALFEYLQANRGNDVVRLFYAAALPLFTIVLMRGHPDDTMGRTLFLILPIVLVAILAQRREGQPNAMQRNGGPG